MPTALHRSIHLLLAFCLFRNAVVAGQPAVPILVYHRFGPEHSDGMTVTTAHFQEQLDLLRKNHFHVIPMSDFVDWILGKGPAPAPRSVVLTIDDGHRSVYEEARPIVIQNTVSVTLFIYPSCISRAPYAMTRAQLRDLADSPFFSIQSHTFWHPNFNTDLSTMNRAAYESFVDHQLRRSKKALEDELGRRVLLLAWPFGIHDDYLMSRASLAGYDAAFSIECRAAGAHDPMLALPRCLVSDEDVGPRFIRFINAALRNTRKRGPE